MFVHFLLDEKISDQIIENFDLYDNVYFLVFSSKEEYTYVQNKGDRILKFDITCDNIKSVVNEIKPSHVILHSMHIDFVKALGHINDTVTITWFAWGFDIYSLPKIRYNLYGEATKRKYLFKTDKFFFMKKIFINNRLMRFVSPLLKRKDYTEIYNLTKRTKFFASYIKEDLDYYSRYYANDLKFVYCPFLTIDQYMGGDANLQIDVYSKNILIGNSNSPESNYFDVIQRLSEPMASDIKLYFVLSYGINERHKNQVMKYANDKLGNKFYPLISFIPRADYINILRSCGVGIFYHFRQQAMGNIISMLYMGSRIYLSSKNPVYHFLLRNDILVFDFDKEYSMYQNTTLTGEEIQNNRKQLAYLFGEDAVHANIIEFYKCLNQSNGA